MDEADILTEEKDPNTPFRRNIFVSLYVSCLGHRNSLIIRVYERTHEVGRAKLRLCEERRDVFRIQYKQR
jgi:hypothetical protein